MKFIVKVLKGKRRHNKALHWTAIPLRSIAAVELCRYSLSIRNRQF